MFILKIANITTSRIYTLHNFYRIDYGTLKFMRDDLSRSASTN